MIACVKCIKANGWAAAWSMAVMDYCTICEVKSPCRPVPVTGRRIHLAPAATSTATAEVTAAKLLRDWFDSPMVGPEFAAADKAIGAALGLDCPFSHRPVTQPSSAGRRLALIPASDAEGQP